jgi:hypothetical protein
MLQREVLFDAQVQASLRKCEEQASEVFSQVRDASALIHARELAREEEKRTTRVMRVGDDEEEEEDWSGESPSSSLPQSSSSIPASEYCRQLGFHAGEYGRVCLALCHAVSEMHGKGEVHGGIHIDKARVTVVAVEVYGEPLHTFRQAALSVTC